MDKQLRDEERRKEQRLDRAKMDAFNLGMSEGIKVKNKERPKTCDVGVNKFSILYCETKRNDSISPSCCSNKNLERLRKKIMFSKILEI